MKKFFLTLVGSILLFSPGQILAHGGVSQVVNNTIVVLNQNPLSPLVGEKVDFAFSFRDQKFQPLSNLGVELKLISTVYNDESKDDVILTQNLKTDANGIVEFNYTFEKENYFDIELTFNDPVTQTPETTGFLVQPRATAKINSNLIIITVIGIGALLSIFFRTRKTQNQ